ncbi:MAG: type II toxin-antitoxin system prevent-host-death family antitoxin [Deltaproteobacteria bacterium]|nr:type II toxin-antitoxin system prevent-host-death family antitoxin [Deltaproteobacteria bacterium]
MKSNVFTEPSSPEIMRADFSIDSLFALQIRLVCRLKAEAGHGKVTITKCKNRLSEMVNKALKDGPKVITRHGTESEAMVSFKEFQRLPLPKTDFGVIFQTGAATTFKSIYPAPRTGQGRCVVEF